MINDNPDEGLPPQDQQMNEIDSNKENLFRAAVVIKESPRDVLRPLKANVLFRPVLTHDNQL